MKARYGTPGLANNKKQSQLGNISFVTATTTNISLTSTSICVTSIEDVA